MKLEAPYEQTMKSNVHAEKLHHVERLWNMTKKLNVLYEKNWTTEAELILDQFMAKIHEAVKRKGWDGKESDEELMWSFAGSLLYSITVITTIGEFTGDITLHK